MKKYIESFVNYRFLLWELVKKGIKLKYRRSYLGIIWSLLEPLLTMIVLTIVFGTILGTRTKEFSVYILCGRLLYNFYSTSTKSALTSIRRNAAMIKKVYVPKYLYTLSSILYNYIIFLISLIVLVVVAAVLNVQYHVNRNLSVRGVCPLNEYLSFLGLDEVDGGDVIGWDICYMIEEMDCYWLDFDNHKTTLEDGLECIIIDTMALSKFE